MKNHYLLFASLLSLVFLLYTSSSAQVRTNFIQDLDGVSLTSSEIIAESNSYSEMFDPGFTMYPGFPKQGLYSVISPKTGAIYCNLDADPDMEIIFGAGETLYAVKLDGSAVPGWPKTFTQYYEAVWTASFGDIDGDGEGEVVAGIGGPLGGHIQAFRKNGDPVPGFPVNVGKYPMSPTLADLDGDGAMEIIMGTRTGQAVVYKGNGTMYPGWPIQMDRYVGASASVGDVNNDGVLDIVMESRNRLYVWNKDGQILPGFPYAIFDSTQGSTSYSAPVLADLTGDGKQEIIFCSHADPVDSGGIIYAVKYDGTSLPGWPKFVPNWIYGAPIVADIDGDSQLEVIIGEYGASVTPMFSIFAYNVDGSLVTNFPMGPFNGSANQITVADIDNDGQFEIIFDENVTEAGLGKYTALNMNGTPVTGWPLQLTQNTSFQQPLLGDLNNDGILDFVGGSFNFDINNKQVFLFAWNTGLPYNPTKIVNAMYQFNPQHSGFYVDPSTIPVELVSFTSLVTDNDITLNWITATELNNHGFEIFRSTPDNNTWNKVTFVEGRGTTTETQAYSITDKNLSAGKYYYRLEQIDFDGTRTTAGSITVNVGAIVKDFVLEQNYPNPFNPVTSIQYAVADNQFVTLKVYDVLGNEVATLVDEYKEPGIYNVQFSVGQNSSPDIASGIYFYTLKAGNFTQTRKMLLLK